jgi:hypothetical protein
MRSPGYLCGRMNPLIYTGETYYHHHANTCNSSVILYTYLPTIVNNNMADTRTCNMRATPATADLGFCIDVWKSICENTRNFR